MSGTYVNIVQERIDSENYNSGTNTGNYSTAQKINPATFNNNNAVIPISDFMPVNIANIQSYFFGVDAGAGNAANGTDVCLYFNTTSGNVQCNLTGGQGIAFDVVQAATVANNATETANTVQKGIFSGFNNAGSYNNYGAQITGMSVRCNNNVTGGCNLTGRIATS
jgi:hypothetical protein